MPVKPSFEKFLLDQKVVGEDVLKSAASSAASRRVSLVEALSETASVGQEELAGFLAKYHEIQYQPGPLVLRRELVTQFPAFTLKRFRVVPLQKTDQTLVVATANPGNLMALDEIRRISKLKVTLVCTTEKAINDALASISAESPAGTIVPAPTKPAEPEAELAIDHANTAAHIDRLLQMSLSRMASDIHFEPQTGFALVRERIDGILYEVERMGLDVYAPVLSRMKLLAGMDIVDKRLAQDGRFRYEFKGGHCEMRASTVPTIHGEKMVLRLLRSDKTDPSLDVLEIGESRTLLIREICKLHDGLILVAGPTGSGKTTTIYSILNELDRKGQNLIMIEDPVEYELQLANQVQINPKIGITFASMLPFILRQDPDIMMVGEIRDEETTQMVMRSAISGHLVFSTIHAPNAVQTMARLLDMKVLPHMIAAALKACISQRLLRKLCQHCREARPATESDRLLLGVTDSKPLVVYEPKGCAACHHIGYSGRFAAMEVLRIEDRLRETIISGDQKSLERVARETGFKTIQDHAAERVVAGETSIGEMLAHCV